MVVGSVGRWFFGEDGEVLILWKDAVKVFWFILEPTELQCSQPLLYVFTYSQRKTEEMEKICCKPLCVSEVGGGLL